MSNARLVILFMGSTLLVSVAGCIWLAREETAIPDVLQIVVGGSLSGLGAILAKTSSDTPSAPVTVEAPSTVEVDARPERGAISLVEGLLIALLVLAILWFTGVRVH